MHKIKSHTAQGFTLVELLIVVTIIGILAMLAIPSYQASVQRGTRAVAVAGLLDLSNRQQQFYLNNRSYASSMADLGYPADRVFSSGEDSAVALSNGRTLVATTSADRVYILKIDNATATAYTISAVPQLAQANDSECGTLTTDNTGARSTSGTATSIDCW
ncbi:MAG: type IV pilin protein [Pseudohongiellaceae bacterium]